MGRGYAVRMVSYAEQQYNSLPREGKAAVSRAIGVLRRDPEVGDFNRRQHNWSYSTRRGCARLHDRAEPGHHYPDAPVLAQVGPATFTTYDHWSPISA